MPQKGPQHNDLVCVLVFNTIHSLVSSLNPLLLEIYYVQNILLKIHYGLPWCLCLQCGRPLFSPWVGKTPWRRERLPTPVFLGFPGGSAGKESASTAGDLGSIPGSGRSPGEGTGYPLQYSWASLVAQTVKNLPAMQETWVPSLGWEDPLEKARATHSSVLAWRSPWTTVHGVAKSRTRLSDSLHFTSQLLCTSVFSPVTWE